MRIKYLVFAGVLAGILVTSLPVRAQPADAAADSCLGPPTQKAPEGSKWRYRVDPATNRKCYFLRADADSARTVATKPERQRSPVTSPSAETLGGAPALGQPTASSRTTAPARVEDAVISARWPDPARAVGAGNPASGTDAGSTTDTQGNMSDQSPDAAAASGSEATSAMDYRLMLAFLAGAVVVAGVIGRMTFRRRTGVVGRVAARQVSVVRPRRGGRRAHPKDITRSLSQSQERMSSIFAPAAAGAPRHFDPAPMGAAAPMTEDVEEDVELDPQHDHTDFRPQPAPEPVDVDTAEEIDVLLRQLERFGERPAA
jgi:hypothetical protein